MMKSFVGAFFWFLILLSGRPVALAQIGGTGWSPLTVAFKVQSPTNAPQSARYFFTNNIYHCLTYSNDGAFEVGNTTLPRTEQRFDPDYTNGEIQYQATLMAPSNENSYCVFQIHTGDAESDAYGSTTFMLFWFTNYGGSVHDYSGTTLATNLGNKWFQLNVDHNLVTGTIRVWVDQNLVWTQQDNGAGDFYFKDGVYEQDHGPTLQMDTYITNSIKMWTNSGVNPPAAPLGLVAAPSPALIGLSWDPSVGATTYNVKRSTTNGGPYTTISSTAGTNYTDTGVASGTTYYYVVSAEDQFGESTNSTPVAALSSTLPTAYWTNTVTATAQNWNLNVNWTNVNAFPDSANELAVINGGIAAPQTITLNQSVVIGALQVGAANGLASYIITNNGGSLTFSGTNTVLLTQLATSRGDVLATPISFTTNLVIANDSTNPLTLAGTLAGSGGSALTLEGTLRVGDGTTNGSLGTVNVTNNGILYFNRSDSVTFSGVVSGPGSIVQNGNGNGVLTLGGPNTFSGGVTVSNGILKAGNGSALGATSGMAVVTNGGTLDVNGNNLGSEPIMVSGWGVNSNGAIISTASTAQDDALQNVTLTGDTAFGGAGNWLASGNPGRWDIRGSGTALTMNGGLPFNLYKVGSNQISIVGVNVDPNLANINIQQGMMGFEDGSTSMGNPESNLVVSVGATLEFYQSSAPNNSYTKQFVLYGDGITPCITNWVGGGSSTIYGQMTLNGTCVIGVNGTSFTNNCAIVGGGSLVKTGPQPLTLGGANDYTGTTTVAGGNLLLAGNGSISGSPAIVINSGAALNAAGRSDGTLTLLIGQSLTGSGALIGNVTVENGAVLRPGGSLTTLLFSNNLVLASGSMTVMEVSRSPVTTNDQAQVAGSLFYGGTLVITNVGSSSLAAGDSFKLFNAGSYSGLFANIIPAIPALNLAWNTNNLNNGMLSIVSSPTPAPWIGEPQSNGNNLIFTAGNGVPNWTYYVVTSTNLTLPLNQWTTIATNTFDSSGDSSFTNSIDAAAPQQFYVIELKP